MYAFFFAGSADERHAQRTGSLEKGGVNVQFHSGIKSDAAIVFDRWARIDSSKKVCTDRFCNRSVCVTVKIRSVNRQPDSLWQPNAFFRQRTPARSIR
jgi:hypothetical protein